MENDFDVTMCLCNYARAEQTHQIIDELRSQTARVQVFVWNNNPEIHFSDKNAHLVINCSENMHVKHVPALWQMANAPFVGRMDDDLHFADNTLVRDALEFTSLLPDVTRLVGAFGVRIYSDSSYSDGHHISVPKGHGQLDKEDNPKKKHENYAVDLVKGRFLLANKAASNYLLCNCPHYHVDLYMSMKLANYRRQWHHVAGCFYDLEKKEGRLLDFPVDGKGYCDMDNHTTMRNGLTDAWVAQCGPHKKTKAKPIKDPPELDPGIPIVSK